MDIYNYYEIEQVKAEQRRDRMAEDVHARLVQQAYSSAHSTPRFHWRGLARLGQLMMEWGCQLQTRYQPLEATGQGMSLFSRQYDPCGGRAVTA
jgi:hypothetical protein